jgi:hypothetical protein
MRGVAVAVVLERLLADPTGRILLDWWRVRSHRWKFLPLFGFFGCGFSVADSLLVVAH